MNPFRLIQNLQLKKCIHPFPRAIIFRSIRWRSIFTVGFNRRQTPVIESLMLELYCFFFLENHIVKTIF